MSKSKRPSSFKIFHIIQSYCDSEVDLASLSKTSGTCIELDKVNELLIIDGEPFSLDFIRSHCKAPNDIKNYRKSRQIHLLRSHKSSYLYCEGDDPSYPEIACIINDFRSLLDIEKIRAWHPYRSIARSGVKVVINSVEFGGDLIELQNPIRLISIEEVISYINNIYLNYEKFWQYPTSSERNTHDLCLLRRHIFHVDSSRFEEFQNISISETEVAEIVEEINSLIVPQDFDRFVDLFKRMCSPLEWKLQCKFNNIVLSNINPELRYLCNSTIKRFSHILYDILSHKEVIPTSYYDFDRVRMCTVSTAKFRYRGIEISNISMPKIGPFRIFKGGFRCIKRAPVSVHRYSY